MSEIKLKRKNEGLLFKTFDSKDGKNSFIVFKQSDGSFHTFVEVEAKDAAIACGSELNVEKHTNKHWSSIW